MNAPMSHERRKMSVPRFLAVAFLGLICGLTPTGSLLWAASPWFSGYLDPNNNYRFYAFTDWDTPLFGAGIEPDTDAFGIAAPAYRVDGHVIFEADGTGFAKVIEATGSNATHPALMVGAVQPVSFQFSNWFSNPGFPPVSDTRGDYNANFLNIVSGLVVPEPASLTILALGGVALLARRRR